MRQYFNKKFQVKIRAILKMGAELKIRKKIHYFALIFIVLLTDFLLIGIIEFELIKAKINKNND